MAIRIVGDNIKVMMRSHHPRVLVLLSILTILVELAPARVKIAKTAPVESPSTTPMADLGTGQSLYSQLKSMVTRLPPA